MARQARRFSTPYGDSTTTMASFEPRRDTIDLDDISRHIRPSGTVPQRPPRRRSTDEFEEWRTIDVDSKGFGQEEWPRYSKMEKEPSAYPAPLRTGTGTTPMMNYNHQPDANFLHPPTPDPRESTFDHRKQDEFGDTISLTAKSHHSIKKGGRFGWWTFGFWLICAMMVTLTAVYSTGSAKALMRQNFFVASPGNSILLLRVLTELCAILIAGLVVVVVEDLQWALASRPGGVSLLHFVGLDSGTGVWGLLRLLATADWKQKYSSLFRLLVILSIPLPGVILMGRISIDMVTFPEKTYAVSAGISHFNASYVYNIRPSTTTALLVQMGSPAWSDRDSFSLDPLTQGVGKCTGENGEWSPCEESHLLTGGVVSIAPQSDDLIQYPGSAAYVVPNTRVVQLEYGKVHDLAGLRKTGRCFLLGAPHAASYWCTGVDKRNGLLFGSAYCPISLQVKSSCLNSTDWTNTLTLSSSLFAYTRHATITYDRGNFSILAVTDMTAPTQEVISLPDYMLALSAVVPGFNSSVTVDATKGDNSALAIYAVTALPINDSAVAKKQLLRAIRKAMSVPFNYFHANYFSDGPSIFELKTPREGLTEDMYTTLSISILSHQVVAGQISRILFVLVSAIILGLSLAIMIATARSTGKRPERCGYPTLDFAAVCAVRGNPPPDWERPDPPGGQSPPPNGLQKSLTQLGQKPKPFEVAKNIKNDRVIIH